jgi:hypothetical protein
MPDLGVVVGVGRWRAIVHYTDCIWYREAQHSRMPIPASMPVRLCRWCRPSEDDVRTSTPAVEWYPFSPSPGAGERPRVVHMDMETAENYRARRDMGWGRAEPKARGM